MVRAALRALVRPSATRDDPPSASAAAGIVLLVAAAAFASTHVAGGVLASHVTGTDTVDNPNYPGDRFCNDDTPNDEFGTLTGCGQPERVERSLSSVTLGAVQGRAGGAFLGTLLLWPVVAGFVHGLTEGHGGGVFETARQVAPAFLPALGRHAARPVAVAREAPSWNHPDSVDPLRRAAAEFAGGDGTWLVGVVAVTVAWQAYVLAGAAAARSTDRASGYGVAGLAGLVVAVLAVATAPTRVGLGGLLLAAVGLALVVAPEALLRFEVRLDLVGYRTTGEVEPRSWLVAVHRLFGVFLVAVGVWLVGGTGYV